MLISRKHQSSTLPSICEGNPTVNGGSPHRGPVTKETFPCHDIMDCAFSCSQGLQLEAGMDLTGMTITASKPVVVLSGATSYLLPSDRSYPVDHFSEQLIPTTKWGQTYAAVPLPRTNYNEDSVRVVGKNDTFSKVWLPYQFQFNVYYFILCWLNTYSCFVRSHFIWIT